MSEDTQKERERCFEIVVKLMSERGTSVTRHDLRKVMKAVRDGTDPAAVVLTGA